MKPVEAVSLPPFARGAIPYPPPLFSGGPLAVINVLSLPEDTMPGQQLWLWQRTDNLEEQSRKVIEQLTGQGWREVVDPLLAMAVETQLYGCLRLVGEGEGQLWFQPGYDLGEIAPILLCFSIPAGRGRQRTSRPMLNGVPPPRYGEYALFAHGPDHFATYRIQELASWARARWERLGQEICALASPLGKWPDHQWLHRLVFEEPDPQVALHRAVIKMGLTFEIEHWEQVHQLEQSLQRAREQVACLQEAQRKDEWCERWETIHLLARLLAHDYFQHHLRQSQPLFPSAPITPQTEPAPVAPPETGTDSAPMSEPAMPPQIPCPPTEIGTNAPSVSEPTAPPETPGAPAETGADSQAVSEPDPSLEATVEPEPGAEPSEKKRGRGKRLSPTPIVARGCEMITIPSDQVSRQINRALRSREGYRVYQEMQVAEYRQSFYQKERGELSVVLKPGKGKSVEELLELLKRMGDRYVDLFLALQAIAIERNGTCHERIRAPILVNVDDLLEVCGKQKSNGSYIPEQRAEVRHCLAFLSYLQIIAWLPEKHGKGKQATMVKSEGPLLGFTESAQQGLLDGADNERHRIMMGPWMEAVMAQGQQTAVLLRKVLAYSAKNQVYQKRLGLYLTGMFRANAHRGGSFRYNITMSTLLENADISLPKDHAERFIKAILQALEDLKKDGVIGGYHLVVDTTPAGQQRAQYIQQQGQGWFDLFLVQQWNFSPSEATSQQYRSLRKTTPAEGHS